MSWLSAVAIFIGKVLREIIPAFYDELRQPRKTRQVGGSQDTFEKVNKSIREYYSGRDHPNRPDPDPGLASGMRPEGPPPTPPPSPGLNHRFQRPPPSILPGSGHKPTR